MMIILKAEKLQRVHSAGGINQQRDSIGSELILKIISRGLVCGGSASQIFAMLFAIYLWNV